MVQDHHALGFAGYFWEFFQRYIPGLTGNILGFFGEHPSVLVITLFVGTAFIWLNIRGAEVTGKAENVLTISKLLILISQKPEKQIIKKPWRLWMWLSNDYF